MKQDGLLRAALRANALFSTLCGLTLLLFAGALEPRLGIPALALRVVGGVLLPFAYGLWSNAARSEVDTTQARVAVVLDFAWVLGSAALLFSGAWPLTQAGRWTVFGISEVVLLWAVLQVLGLRRASSLQPRS